MEEAAREKHRIFTTALVSEVERTVFETGGELRVASDVEEYFGMIQGLIAAQPRFRQRRVVDVTDPYAQREDLTSFERKYRLEGRPIFRAHYVLKEPGA